MMLLIFPFVAADRFPPALRLLMLKHGVLVAAIVIAVMLFFLFVSVVRSILRWYNLCTEKRS